MTKAELPAALDDGDLRANRQRFDAAYRRAESDGHADAMGRSALGFAGRWLRGQRGSLVAVIAEARLSRALGLVAASSPLALRMRARLTADDEYGQGTHAGILALLAEARNLDDPAVAAETAHLAQQCLLGPDHDKLRRALAELILAAAAESGDREHLLTGLLWRAINGVLVGDPDVAHHLAPLRAQLVVRDHLAIGHMLSAVETMLAIRAGCLEKSQHMALACAEQGFRAGHADAVGWYGAQTVAVSWYQGRIGGLVTTLQELASTTALTSARTSFVAALAVAAAHSGDVRLANDTVDRLSGQVSHLPRAGSWLVTLHALAEAAYFLGNPGLAAATYQLLLPYAEVPMTAAMGVVCFGSAHQALGVTSLAAGEPARAVAHLRAALRSNQALGHRPAAVLSRARLAEALDAVGTSPDESRRQAARAHDEADRLAMAIPSRIERPSTTVVGTVTRPRPYALVCRRHGRQWFFGLGEVTAHVKDSVGMKYLAILLANPGYRVASLELVSGPQLPDVVDRDLPVGSLSTPQPLLDEVSKRQYRTRLADLAAEIDQLDRDHDLARLERARSERDWLLEELAVATGLNGRTRYFANADERARISVGKAIRRAISRIETAEPVIGRHLRATVETGHRCCYRPLI